MNRDRYSALDSLYRGYSACSFSVKALAGAMFYAQFLAPGPFKSCRPFATSWRAAKPPSPCKYAVPQSNKESSTNIYRKIVPPRITTGRIPALGPSSIPHTPLLPAASAHDEHLEALDPVPQRRVLLGEAPVLPFEVCDVLGRLAEDGRLVQLVRRRQAT